MLTHKAITVAVDDFDPSPYIKFGVATTVIVYFVQNSKPAERKAEYGIVRVALDPVQYA